MSAARLQIHPSNASNVIKETPKVTWFCRLFNRKACASLVAMAAVLLGIVAAPAMAAPELGIQVTRITPTIARGSEWLEYMLRVKNVSPGTTPVIPGSNLRCSYNSWFNSPTFSYQWLRDGISLGSANGANSLSYTVQEADKGHALQCMVTGANASGSAGAVTAPFIVSPAPSPMPPVPTEPKGEGTRPSVSVVESTKRLCTAPTGWAGSPAWTYQWLRNGAPIAGASEEKYTPDVAGADKNKVLQCQVLGTNAGGAAIAISNNVNIGSPGLVPSNAPASSSPFVATPDYAVGPLTLEIEGPPGESSVVLAPEVNSTGFNCVTHSPFGGAHSISVCTSVPEANEAFVAPGNSYTGKVGSINSPLMVRIAVGADTPDTIVTKFRASGMGAVAPASAQDEITFEPEIPFGLVPGVFATKVADQFGADYTQAGGHPTSAGETFEFNWTFDSKHQVRPTDHVKNANTQTPAGFVGNALAVPVLCEDVEAVLFSSCPLQSMVGGVDIFAGGISSTPSYPGAPGFGKLPVYAIEPEYGAPAQFAFGIAGIALYTFTPELRAEDNYAISLNPAPIVKNPALLGVTATLCGFGAKRSGAGAALSNEVGAHFAGCKAPNEPGANPIPLVTNPSRCSGPPPTTKLVVDSWEHPDAITSDTFAAPQITGCGAVAFEPETSLHPTNHEADSPTGMGVEIKMPSSGLESGTGISQANLDNATVTFPKGMSINASTADGLQACSLAQVKLHSNSAAECPESSKVGAIEIKTPLIRETLTGGIYVAQQNHNPFNSALGLYMVFSSKKDGVTIKVAGKIAPDPVTGQLVSTFTENPEAPFSRLALHFNEGPRAPLVNPPVCGTFDIHSEASPWSAVNPANPTPEEIVSEDSSFEVTSGPNGSSCPAPDLKPKLKAGLQSAQAGAKSPFVFSLSRDDGTQRFTGLSVTTPKGLTAYLKGIPYCPDAILAGISEAEETGRAELASPSCPAASQVGTSEAGAGSGPFPFHTKGRVYLAGPYKGAPVSLAVVTPAVAGPFDLGNVVIRNALYVNPETAQVTTKSDPIPTILHGILLDVRDIRVSLDRPSFTAAPTSCEPMSVDATVSGLEGAAAAVSNPFQVGGCAALGFKPKLSLRLFGGTHRNAHPRLRATLTARPGDADIAGASVALPHSEFLDQGHIRTVCTRTQFAARECPQGSIYGEAEATTPLLDSPLRGPVYLRSSANPLPDLVAALRGPDSQPIEVVLDGRIDSVHGGIRSTFEAVPDQPVSSFTLNMQGGKKGLLVNSRDICKSTARATAKFTAQNGRTAELRPELQNSCGKSAAKHKRHSR